jgi:hypothetical protein
MQGDFSLKLPPGTFSLEAYGEVLNPEGLTYSIHKEITISADKMDVDLGVLEVELSNKLKAKLAGTWGDLTKYYGKEPPAWHVRACPKSALPIAGMRS